MRHDPFDMALVVVYLAAMLALGLYSRKHVRSFDDFFVAGRRLGFLMSLGTLSAIFVGGGAIGLAGQGFQFGLSGVWYYWAYAVGFLVLVLTFLPMLRSLKQYTIADIIGDRFGPGARFTCSLVTFTAWLFFLAALIVAGGRVVEVVFGIPLLWAVLFMAAVFLTYTTFGGMWAVALTDLVQAGLLLVSIAVLFTLALVRLGGWTATFSALPQGYGSVVVPGHGPYLFALLWIIAPTTIVGPDIYLKIWCMKDDRTARRTVWALIAIVLVWAVMLAFLGAAARIMVPGVDPELALPSMVRAVVSPGLSGLILVALMAAAVSGAVPQVVVCSSILTRDIYQGLLHKTASPERLLRASRINTVLVGIVGTALALWMPGVVELSLQAYRIFVPAVVLQVLAAFYWPRARPRAVIASMVAGPLVTVASAWLFPHTQMTYRDPVIPGLITALAVLLIPGLIRSTSRNH